MKKRSAVAVVATAVAIGAFAPAAQAAGVGPNASFQTGNFSHWKEKTVACGSGVLAEFDTFAIGFTYPAEFGGAVVPTPPGGHAAIFGQDGSGWGVVSRTFTIPPKARRLSFRIWWSNRSTPVVWQRASSINCPGGPPSAQMVYADLLKPGSPSTSLKPKNRLVNLWQPREGITPAASGTWRTVTASVRKLRGKRVTFRLGALATRDSLNVALTGLRVR
jgi:hypothetical protein